jgi:hypothetical protein
MVRLSTEKIIHFYPLDEETPDGLKSPEGTGQVGQWVRNKIRDDIEDKIESIDSPKEKRWLMKRSPTIRELDRKKEGD